MGRADFTDIQFVDGFWYAWFLVDVDQYPTLMKQLETVNGAAETNLVAGDVIGATQSAVVLENLISQFLFSKAADGATTPAPEKK